MIPTIYFGTKWITVKVQSEEVGHAVPRVIVVLGVNRQGLIAGITDHRQEVVLIASDPATITIVTGQVARGKADRVGDATEELLATTAEEGARLQVALPGAHRHAITKAKAEPCPTKNCGTPCSTCFESTSPGMSGIRRMEEQQVKQEQVIRTGRGLEDEQESMPHYRLKRVGNTLHWQQGCGILQGALHSRLVRNNLKQ